MFRAFCVSARSVTQVVLLALIALNSLGCQREALPPTYVVKGKCVQKNGKPLTGGTITFTSISNPESRGYGEIQSDGSFELRTIGMRQDATSEVQQGATEGEFSVSIRLAESLDENGNPEPSGGRPPNVVLKKKYKIEPKELNEFEIVVE